MPSRLSEFFSGIKDELPILIEVIPFGIIFGVLALEAGILPIASQAMSSIIFAGSAQIVTTQLVAVGAPGLVIVLTVGVVNLRHLLYSASIAPYMRSLKFSWKWLLAYLLTDEAYAVTIHHYEYSDQQNITKNPINKSDANGNYKHWFFLGAGLALWTTWQISTAMGILLGAVVPENWSLDFTLALTFIALVIPNLKDRSSTTAAIVAGVAAVAAFHLPYKLGLIVAALLGILVGVLLEVKSK